MEIILCSQIFYTYVCWGVHLRPSNLCKCKYVLVTKTTNLRSSPTTTHRSNVALHLSVLLFKIILTIILDCLLFVSVEIVISFSSAINFRVQSGLLYLAIRTPHVTSHCGDKRELQIFK